MDTGQEGSRPVRQAVRGAPPALLTSAAISDRMARQRRRDTTPELLLRRDVHGRGLRYLVDARLPGMPRRRSDLLFTRARIAVFVDGCFWHCCPEHGTMPATNTSWWARKLEANVVRDRETVARLHELGWIVLRFWEHEEMSVAADAVECAVRASRR